MDRKQGKVSASDALTDRRGFLKLTGLSAAAGGAALVGASGESRAEDSKTRTGLYSETDHVRTFYELARF